MKNVILPGLILMAYGLIAGLSLGFINQMTAPIIAEQEESARLAAINEVLPDAKVFDPDTAGEIEYLVGYTDSSQTQVVGYVITAFGSGFSSTIRTVVGLEPDFTINAIEIVYQSETPGLGDNAIKSPSTDVEPPFEVQFDGKAYDNIKVDKDGGPIVSLTGATITSRAIANSVARAAKELKEAIGSSPGGFSLPGGPQCDPDDPNDPNCKPDSTAEVADATAETSPTEGGAQ
ncbi:MAG: RnfABCDGE type electron transport complex subunit G [bacterium]